MNDQDRSRRQGPGRRLTDRQAAILNYVAEGFENKEIAHQLGISEQTAKDQVSALLRRLAARNRASLAEIATELRIFGGTVDPGWQQYLFTDAPFGILLMRGPEHRAETMNAYVRRQLGDREIVGKPLREALPSLAASTFEILDRAYESGDPFIAHESALLRARSGQNDVAYFDSVVQPLRGPDGAVNGLLLMYLDVTETVRSRSRS